MSPAAVIRRQISLDASWWSASVVRMNRSKEMFNFSCRRWIHIGVAPRQLGGGQPFGRRRLDHLEAVFVGAGQKPHVEAVEPLEPRDASVAMYSYACPMCGAPLGYVIAVVT